MNWRISCLTCCRQVKQDNKEKKNIGTNKQNNKDYT